jgi:hypothetical protein
MDFQSAHLDGRGRRAGGGHDLFGLPHPADQCRGKTYRIDGGPAIVDFDTFLTDLDAVAGRVRANDASFNPFASAVLQSTTPDPDDVATLRQNFETWYLRYHTLITRALPAASWGVAARRRRHDLQPPHRPRPRPAADLPDRRQHQARGRPSALSVFLECADPVENAVPGFADNGSDVLALSRNLGEVDGVFGVLQPLNDGLVVDFLRNNSANFDGLSKLEDLVKDIGPPKWPWLIDNNLAARGKAIFARAKAKGGCIECHGITAGPVRFPNQQTWATPIDNVGTDTR